MSVFIFKMIFFFYSLHLILYTLYLTLYTLHFHIKLLICSFRCLTCAQYINRTKVAYTLHFKLYTLHFTHLILMSNLCIKNFLRNSYSLSVSELHGFVSKRHVSYSFYLHIVAIFVVITDKFIVYE